MREYDVDKKTHPVEGIIEDVAMERLEQIKTVANNLKTSSTKAIKALHKFIFEQEGDRGNRKRLREFKGSTFASDSDEYRSKIAFVEGNLSWGDLISVCNILAIDYSGTKKELNQRICSCLVDLNSLNDAIRPDGEESDKDDDEQDEEQSDDEDAKRQRKRIGSNKEVRQTREEIEDEEEENETEDEDENKDEKNDERSVIVEAREVSTKFTMTFRDVEDSIRHFNGDEKYPVERWIMDIEESAELFGWTDIQRLIFAKKSLTGLAKLFIQGERGITSWNKLGQALKDEFSHKMNSAELNKLLSKR